MGRLGAGAPGRRRPPPRDAHRGAHDRRRAFAVPRDRGGDLGDTTRSPPPGAVVATVLAAVLVAGSAFAVAAANSIAYGDEQRFPLRTPPGLYAGPLPLARALVVAASREARSSWPTATDRPRARGAGDRRARGAVPGPGVAQPSRRWLDLLVPAGLVVADPLTLADPVLFIREHIVSVRAVDGSAPVPADVLDVRLGATAGWTRFLTFDEEAELMRSTRARRGARAGIRLALSSWRRCDATTCWRRRPGGASASRSRLPKCGGKVCWRLANLTSWRARGLPGGPGRPQFQTGLRRLLLPVVVRAAGVGGAARACLPGKLQPSGSGGHGSVWSRVAPGEVQAS